MAGVYIHIPFCKQACNYCNFHFSTSLTLKHELIAAIIKEISCTDTHKYADAESLSGQAEIIDTIYFGGGTPSILNAEDLSLTFTSLHKKFTIAQNVEITLEANPDDISMAKLLEWKSFGINRLSVGIQSFIEDELIWMNRAHTAKDSLQCIDEIKLAGYTNFSVDLIYGSPLLNDDMWKENVTKVIEKNVPHVSCYALTVEPKTALDKMIEKHLVNPTNPERQATQFLLLMDWLQMAGYHHYEISNFAKPGMESKHNSSYWQGKKYYGFGPSAHSFDGERRRWNVANNALYIQSLKKDMLPFEEETLTETQKINEYIMTSLRTSDGLSLLWVNKKFGKVAVEKLIRQVQKWKATGKVLITAQTIKLTAQGKLFADGIAADLFF